MPISGLNGKLRKYWKRRRYSTRHGSAAVCLPPPAGFVRVYHFTKLKYARQALRLGRLKLARFSDLNDPFELFAASFEQREVRRILRELKARYDDDSGLLCFSADWTDPLLWAHYGDRHKGVCLGFNVTRAKIQRVKYRARRIETPGADPLHPFTIDDELKNTLLHTKYSHWRYEREWRMLVKLQEATQAKSKYFRPFDTHLQLAEVILGGSCTERELGTFRKLTANYHLHAVTFQARPAFKFFSIVPRESTVRFHLTPEEEEE